MSESRFGVFLQTIWYLQPLFIVVSMVSLSPLGDLEGHNVVISLREPIIITGLYGMKKEAQELAFFVDTPEAFIAEIQSKTKELS